MGEGEARNGVGQLRTGRGQGATAPDGGPPKGPPFGTLVYVLGGMIALATLGSAFLLVGGDSPPRQPALEEWLSESGRAQRLEAFHIERLRFHACPPRWNECRAEVTRFDAPTIEVGASRLPVGIRTLDIRACDDACDGYEVRAEVNPERVSRTEAESGIALSIALALAEVAMQKERAASWNAVSSDE